MRRTTTQSRPLNLQKRLQGNGFSPSEQTTLEELISEPIAYIPHESFDNTAAIAETMDKNLHFAAGARLSRQDEADLFLQLNYARHQLCEVRRQLLGRRRWARQPLSQLLY